MRTVDLIHRKRGGEELAPEEIAFLVNGYTSGEIPDYQMSAFLMAVFFSGMSDREVSALTESMMHSGAVLDLSDIPGVKVEKHSTGCGSRRNRAHDLRPQPRPHRRNVGQTGVHPRLPTRSVDRRVSRPVGID